MRRHRNLSMYNVKYFVWNNCEINKKSMFETILLLPFCLWWWMMRELNLLFPNSSFVKNNDELEQKKRILAGV